VVYTKEFTGYEKEYDNVSEKLQKVLTWVASIGTEGDDVVTTSGHSDFEVD
jgi:hypothetical protein